MDDGLAEVRDEGGRWRVLSWSRGLLQQAAGEQEAGRRCGRARVRVGISRAVDRGRLDVARDRPASRSRCEEASDVMNKGRKNREGHRRDVELAPPASVDRRQKRLPCCRPGDVNVVQAGLLHTATNEARGRKTRGEGVKVYI
jgi:hypothetical protein